MSTLDRFDLLLWRQMVPRLDVASCGRLILIGNAKVAKLVPLAFLGMTIPPFDLSTKNDVLTVWRQSMGVLRVLYVNCFVISDCISYANYSSLQAPRLHLGTNLCSLRFDKLIISGTNNIQTLPSSLLHLDLGIVSSDTCKSCFNFKNLQLESFVANLYATPLAFQKSITTFLVDSCSGSLRHLALRARCNVDLSLCGDLHLLDYSPQCGGVCTLSRYPPRKKLSLHFDFLSSIETFMSRLPMRYLKELSYLELTGCLFKELYVDRFVGLSRLKIGFYTAFSDTPTIHVTSCDMMDIVITSIVTGATIVNNGPGDYNLSFRHLKMGTYIPSIDWSRANMKALRSVCIDAPQQLLPALADAINLKKLEVDTYMQPLLSFSDVRYFKLTNLSLTLTYKNWAQLSSSSVHLTSLSNLCLRFRSNYSFTHPPAKGAHYFPPNLTQLEMDCAYFYFEMLNHFPRGLQTLSINGFVPYSEKSHPSFLPPPAQSTCGRLYAFLFGARPQHDAEPPIQPRSTPNVALCLECICHDEIAAYCEAIFPCLKLRNQQRMNMKRSRCIGNNRGQLC